MHLKEEQRAVNSKGAELVEAICDYIKENQASRITLSLLGEHFGISPYYLQRIFVKVMGISPRRYLEECRLNVLKGQLSKGEPVLSALRRTGYASQSWLYGDWKLKLGMTPSTYRKGAFGILLMYALGDCPLGRLLVAATNHGICSIKVGRDDEEVVASLRREYPKAQLMKTERVMPFVEDVRQHLQGVKVKLPLDIRGTDFQLRVWTAIQRIPIGETRSYSDVAQTIGRPLAVRAVANACASNPVPLIIPCHRVIRNDGSLGGYGLGLPRKRILLALEGALAMAGGQEVRWISGNQPALSARWFDTPLGPVLAVADEIGLRLLEFADRRALPREITGLRRKLGPIRFGENDVLDLLALELRRYFSGSSTTFRVRIAQGGTEFDKRVWTALRKIPPGQIRTYADLARSIGCATAVRAVARANGNNQLSIVVPCHRVVGADGSLLGYGGKLWRKKWLLEHEQWFARPSQSA
ncbi:MAG TPA: methylated-DNA--[protein]-cysteine S-methyltransferase [Nitrososphaerales archaeon]|nr:methylated-DNA--[protein]-cysteine S-methyltransferase [Nitrososphaerales archaeon]